MKLDAILRAHSFMHVERPPLLWDIDAQDERFVGLLGELIVFVLRTSKYVHRLTLNASNVVVEEDAAGPHWPAGEYVAISVLGPDHGTPELKWWPGAPRTFDQFGDLDAAASRAGVVYIYSRDMDGEGSITALFRRNLN
jgi:hypothetical protein